MTTFIELNVDFSAVRWFVLAGSLLILKCIFSNMYVGLVKQRTATLGSPEDRLFGGDGSKPWSALTHPDVIRAGRIVFNDQENIPLWFFAALMFLLTGASGTEARNWFMPYALARCAHTAIYMAGLQPARAIVFIASLLLQLGPVAISIYRVL